MVWGAAVVVAEEEVGEGVVREVADAAHDALLDGPRVGAVAEHFEVVVGFEEQDVDALERGLDVGWDVAEVGGDGHADVDLRWIRRRSRRGRRRRGGW